MFMRDPKSTSPKESNNLEIKQQNQEFFLVTTKKLGCLLLTIIGLFLFIAVPSFLNRIKEKGPDDKAKQLIANLNKGHQAYYVEYLKFTNIIHDLGIAIKTESDIFIYKTEIVNDKVVKSTATAKNNELLSYTGAVFILESQEKQLTTTIKSILCEGKEPGIQPSLKIISIVEEKTGVLKEVNVECGDNSLPL